MNALYWPLVWSAHIARTVSDTLADTATVLENLAAEVAPCPVTWSER